MMGSFGFGGLFFVFHSLFALALVLGVIFTVLWANKTMKKEDLGKWAMWLLVIGLAGVLLTGMWKGGFGGYPNMMRNVWENPNGYSN